MKIQITSRISIVQRQLLRRAVRVEKHRLVRRIVIRIFKHVIRVLIMKIQITSRMPNLVWIPEELFTQIPILKMVTRRKFRNDMLIGIFDNNVCRHHCRHALIFADRRNDVK